MSKFDKRKYKQGLPGLLAIVIGVLYWPSEALIHYLFFDAPSFVEAALQPSPNEAWMRALVVLLFVFFGLFIYRLEMRQRGYISELCTRQNFFIVAHGPVLPSRQMYIELI